MTSIKFPFKNGGLEQRCLLGAIDNENWLMGIVENGFLIIMLYSSKFICCVHFVILICAI